MATKATAKFEIPCDMALMGAGGRIFCTIEQTCRSWYRRVCKGFVSPYLPSLMIPAEDESLEAASANLEHSRFLEASTRLSQTNASSASETSIYSTSCRTHLQDLAREVLWQGLVLTFHFPSWISWTCGVHVVMARYLHMFLTNLMVD